MSNIHQEIKSLMVSTWRKYISEWLERRKKEILQQMLDASLYAGLATDTLDENARKQLYTQHLLKVQYSYIEYLLSIPQTIINSEPPAQTEETIDEYLAIFDRQYT